MAGKLIITQINWLKVVYFYVIFIALSCCKMIDFGVGFLNSNAVELGTYRVPTFRQVARCSYAPTDTLSSQIKSKNKPQYYRRAQKTQDSRRKCNQHQSSCLSKSTAQHMLASCDVITQRRPFHPRTAAVSGTAGDLHFALLISF